MKLFTVKKFYNLPKDCHQADLVLAILKSNGPTTTSKFVALGIKSPSSVIHRLRETGYCIKSRYVKKRVGLFGKWKRQVEYSLHNLHAEVA